MPFTRPALTVGPGAHAAPDARRWVVAALVEVGRGDLADSAELAISELVGNAFLHGSDPITIQLRGNAGCPRVEVHDASPARPRLPQPLRMEDLEEPSDDGRGLALVARASLAWGVTLEDDGKVMWFEPAPELSESEGADAQLADLRTSVH